MGLSVAEVAIVAAGIGGYALVLTALCVRGRWRKFRALTVYVVYGCLSGVLQLLTYQRRAALTETVYWIEVGVDFLFQLCVLAELAYLTFRPLGRGWTQQAILTTGVPLAIGVSSTLAMMIQLPAAVRTKGLWDIRVDVFTSLLVCTLILLYYIAADRLILQHQNDVVAIGRGFAAWAAIALLSDVGYMDKLWLGSVQTLDMIPEVAWLVMLVYWAYTLWQQKPISGASL